MKMKAFTIYDSKAAVFRTPFFTSTVGEALRPLTDAANKEDHEFCKHPEDYTLFEIGEYDEDHATLTPIEPQSVVKIIELKDKKIHDPRQIDLVDRLEKAVHRLTELTS